MVHKVSWKEKEEGQVRVPEGLAGPRGVIGGGACRSAGTVPALGGGLGAGDGGRQGSRVFVRRGLRGCQLRAGQGRPGRLPAPGAVVADGAPRPLHTQLRPQWVLGGCSLSCRRQS